MQTIPSNLNAEELLRWYDSTWNKLTNSEMEERLAAALKEALDENDEQKGFESDLEKAQDDLNAANEKIEVLETKIERILGMVGEVERECRA